MLIEINRANRCRQAKRLFHNAAQWRVAHDGEPFGILRRVGLLGQRAKLAFRVQRQPHIVTLRADSRLKLSGAVCGQNLVGEIGYLRARCGKITEAKRRRQLLILLVGQTIGQRAVLQGAICQDLADKRLVVDVVVQTKGPQGDLQQPAIVDQIVCGLHRFDLRAEIVLVPFDLGRFVERRGLTWQGPLQKSPSRITRAKQNGVKAHIGCAANSRSSRGRSVRNALSA